jgi:hypothetical protein
LAAAVVAACLVSATPTISASAPRKCKGTKVWYANDCRYPDEVERLKGQQKQQQRAKAQQREADAKACREARAAGTADGWRSYLSEHAKGDCRDEAATQIEELESRPAEDSDPEQAPAETASPAPSSAPAQPPPPAAESDTAGISPWAWVGFGVGAAGLLTWGITGGVSMSMSSDIKDDCPNDVCPPEREADIDTAKVLAHVATAGFVVGLAGCTLGVIALVATAGSDGDGAGGASNATDDTRVRAVVVRPHVGPGYVGVSGTF